MSKLLPELKQEQEIRRRDTLANTRLGTFAERVFGGSNFVLVGYREMVFDHGTYYMPVYGMCGQEESDVILTT